MIPLLHALQQRLPILFKTATSREYLNPYLINGSLGPNNLHDSRHSPQIASQLTQPFLQGSKM